MYTYICCPSYVGHNRNEKQMKGSKANEKKTKK
jgi:hypothetical protein